MKLKEISYVDADWELKGLEFSEVNLIVGKNATGKSKTLSTIYLLRKMIAQYRDLTWGGQWKIIFINEKNETVNYNFTCNSKTVGVSSEKITINEEDVLIRNECEEAFLKNILTGEMDIVFPPKDKFIIHTNRDVRKYPYLEEIVKWAENSYGFKFVNNSNNFNYPDNEYELLTDGWDIPRLFQSLPPIARQNLIDIFNEIGFQIMGIDVVQKSKESGVLYLKENDIEKLVPHYQLSQGMYRSLSILICFEYLSFWQNPATIIIDDLCEGLDYERATKLGKIIFEKCLKENIQLIATSNDSFLMDEVDLIYWNILQRDGKTVTALNSHNSSELFRKFKFTGLSNFDFLSSDYIKQNLHVQ